MSWFGGHRINLSGILVPFLYHHTQMKHMWIFQNHLSYTVFIPAIVKLPSNVLYFRVSGHGYSWNMSTQNHHRYLCLAVPTHLQISSAPLCLRAASGTSARFSSPLSCLESYLKEICVPSLGNLGFLMLSNAKQANLQYVYMPCWHSTVYSTILMSGFVIKENT